MLSSAPDHDTRLVSNRVRQPDVKLFSGSRAPVDLVADLVAAYGAIVGEDRVLGKSTSRRFHDGELSYSYDESIRGDEVYLIQSTLPPGDSWIELLIMVDAAKRASARYVTAVVPYFGYARQDRKDRPRVSISAKLMANLLSAAGADRLMTMDLHAGQIQGFFDIPVDHLNSAAIFVPYLKKQGMENMIFAAPDVGSLARTRYYAKHFKADLVVCDKERLRANEIASMQVIGDVQGRDVVLVDDLIDTGGTLCQAAQTLIDKGATRVYAVCTHALLSGNAHERIRQSPLEALIVTDTVPLREKNDKIHVLGVGGLFSQAIWKVHSNGSISSLFIE